VKRVYVVGTADTKGHELNYVRSLIQASGVPTVLVDVGIRASTVPVDVHARTVAAFHPQGSDSVMRSPDRGSAVAAMGEAFARYVVSLGDVGGMLGLGGGGGTSIVTAGMRELAIGVPKVMVSTLAAGDVKAFVGTSDISMMYSVTDVAGLNRISRTVLGNAAHAIAGMASHPIAAADTKPALGLTMFGVTTACVTGAVEQLQPRYDCLVFHATGTGGQSMEKLVESGLLAGVIDATTTEIADEVGGGVLSAGPARLDAIIRSRIPYVGSCGALDVINFWAMDTVPAQHRGRNLHVHNPNVTLMRTTVEECRRIGQFLVDKLNRMQGPVRFLIPQGGVSSLDAPGKSFWDPAADKALFDVLIGGFRTGTDRKLVVLPHNINDPAFIDALVANFNEIAGARPARAAASR